LIFLNAKGAEVSQRTQKNFYFYSKSFKFPLEKTTFLSFYDFCETSAPFAFKPDFKQP